MNSPPFTFWHHLFIMLETREVHTKKNTKLGALFPGFSDISPSDHLVASHLIVEQRVTLPRSSGQNISVNPFCRDSTDILLVGSLDVLVGNLDGAFGENPKGNSYFILCPVQVQGAMHYQHVEVGRHGFLENLAPQEEHFSCLLFKLFDILEF